MSRLRRYRPTPSMFVALVAVVIASSGSAVAATLITSRQIKDGTIQARDLSASARRQLKGNAGPKGDPGRSALTPLQTGESIIGGFDFDANSSGSGQDYGGWVPFPIPASTPLDNAHIFVAGGPAGSVCTGTVAAPTAPPGDVCVYVAKKSAKSTISAEIPGNVTGEPAKRGFRVLLTVSSGGAADVFAQGAWAYTAP